LRYTLLYVCWVTWFWNFSFRLIVPALLPSIQALLSLSHGLAGLLVGAFSLGFTLTAYPAGVLSKRFGLKRLVCVGMIVTVFSMLLFSFPQSYLAMLLLISLAGAGLGVYLPLGLSLLSEYYPPSRRGIILGVHETAAPLGQTVGPIFTGLTIMALGWAGVVRLWLVFAVVPLIAFSALIREDIGHRGFTVPERLEVEGRMPLGLLIAVLAVSTCIWSMSIGMISMMPVYMVHNFKLDVIWAAYLLGASRFGGIFGQLAAGFLSDVFGRFKVISLLMVSSAVSTACFAYAPYGPLFIAALLIQGTLISGFYPVIFATISDHTHPRERGKTLGLVTSVSGILGTVLTPILIGHLADSYGFNYAFLYPVTLGFIGCILLPYLRRQLVDRGAEQSR